MVDPGDDGDRIMDVVKKYGLTVDAILLTHGHADHISGLKEVREGTKAKVYIAAGDADRLTHSTSMFFPGPAKNYGAADVIVKDGDEFEAAGLRFKVLATPGHTPGGVCYVVEDAVFCGDTIFAESIGRTDLPGGNYEELLRSIKEKILPLKDDMMLLPGHGPATNVGWERKRNPFLQ
jgi:glyoxylase-like metal-dependent hydrolase (beta-lactamase superfamily II)